MITGVSFDVWYQLALVKPLTPMVWQTYRVNGFGGTNWYHFGSDSSW